MTGVVVLELVVWVQSFQTELEDTVVVLIVVVELVQSFQAGPCCSAHCVTSIPMTVETDSEGHPATTQDWMEATESGLQTAV